MRPGPAQWMATRITNVGELRALLADKPDNTPLVVAPVADVDTSCSNILNMCGWIEGSDTIVLALAEETTDEDGNLVFPIRPV